MFYILHANPLYIYICYMNIVLTSNTLHNLTESLNYLNNVINQKKKGLNCLSRIWIWSKVPQASVSWRTVIHTLIKMPNKHLSPSKMHPYIHPWNSLSKDNLKVILDIELNFCYVYLYHFYRLYNIFCYY